MMLKEKKRLKRKLSVKICILLAISQLLTSCSMSPQEKDTPSAPVLKSYESESYDIVNVKKGTVLSQKEIDCFYTQTKEEELMFTLPGKIIEKVYHKEGDLVKKGDLLAQLELSYLKKTIFDIKYDIGKLKLLISQTKEIMNLEVDKQQLIAEGTNLSNEETAKTISSIKESYEYSIQDYQSSLSIKEKELKSLTEKVETYKIYASMDGTLSFVKEDLEGSKSVKNRVIFRIVDTFNTNFKSNTKYAKNFKEGEEVTINTTNESYQAVATHSKDEDNVIYFKLVTPDIKLEVGDKGSIQLVLEKKENILYLPLSVVHKMNDSYYVYYVDETGMQNIKPIEIGIKDNYNVEILSGLNYGEAVISK